MINFKSIVLFRLARFPMVRMRFITQFNYGRILLNWMQAPVVYCMNVEEAGILWPFLGNTAHLLRALAFLPVFLQYSRGISRPTHYRCLAVSHRQKVYISPKKFLTEVF